jgi:hypothetical protein
MYAGCPITWLSKLQTEIALSTTEAECIALSQAMREVIPFMNLMQEIDDILGYIILHQRFIAKCLRTTEVASKLLKVLNLHQGQSTLQSNIIVKCHLLVSLD